MISAPQRSIKRFGRQTLDIVTQPKGRNEFLAQAVRRLTNRLRDRVRKYGGDFVRRARAIGIETVLSLVHAPGECARGASDRDDLPRVSRPRGRPQRGASPPSPARVRAVLQRSSSAPVDCPRTTHRTTGAGATPAGRSHPRSAGPWWLHHVYDWAGWRPTTALRSILPGCPGVWDPWGTLLTAAASLSLTGTTKNGRAT